MKSPLKSISCGRVQSLLQLGSLLLDFGVEVPTNGLLRPILEEEIRLSLLLGISDDVWIEKNRLRMKPIRQGGGKFGMNEWMNEWMNSIKEWINIKQIKRILWSKNCTNDWGFPELTGHSFQVSCLRDDPALEEFLRIFWKLEHKFPLTLQLVYRFHGFVDFRVQSQDFLQ